MPQPRETEAIRPVSVLHLEFMVRKRGSIIDEVAWVGTTLFRGVCEGA